MKNYLLLLSVLMLTQSVTLHADDHHRVAFVTSASGTGDLSGWADAGGQTGTAAGDAVCQTLADAAGLNNSDNFVAWLSDSSDDAYCRVHGLSGKKSENCGMTELPASAGPWIRTDGFPFSADISGLTTSNPELFTPLKFDENGESVSTSAIATGTFESGEGAPHHCGNWSIGIDDGTTRLLQGTTTDTGDRWTSLNSPVSCQNDKRLACLESVAGPDLPPFKQMGRIAFATSESGPGNLSAWPQASKGTSGIQAGDSICQHLADAAGLAEPGSFKAWLSDGSTDAVNRWDNDGQWIRADGVPISVSLADLIDGALFTSISVTEEGGYLDRDRAWTGTTSTGLKADDHCNSWSEGSASHSGAWGFTNTTDSQWTEWPSASECDLNQRLYCLSDAVDPLIFEDGFEHED